MKKKYRFLVFYLVCILKVCSQNNELGNCLKTCDKTEIIKEGSFLGVKTVPACDKDGALIVEVVLNSPAEKQNLKVGDFILKLNQQDVFGPLHFKKLINLYSPDDVIELTFIRNNSIILQKVFIGALSTKAVTKKVCCESIDKDFFENEIAISPVPANDKITIQSSIITGNYTIEIYNFNGVLLKSTNGLVESNLKETLDVAAYPEGSYIVMIYNNGRVASKNIIIKH